MYAAITTNRTTGEITIIAGASGVRVFKTATEAILYGLTIYGRDNQYVTVAAIQLGSIVGE